MKSKLIDLSSPLTQSILPARILSRMAKARRILLTALGVTLISISLSPHAQAAKPNGTYDVGDVRGHLRLGGYKVDIPEVIIRRIVRAADGDITISKRTLKLHRNSTAQIPVTISEHLNLGVSASVDGPWCVKLVESGDQYKGKASSPIVTRYHVEVFGVEFESTLNTRVSAIVDGRTIRVNIRFSGSSAGSDFGGRVILTGRR